MRAELRHPEKPGIVANYGHDTALSWWIEVRHEGRLVVEYDALTVGTETRPSGILGVLLEQGFLGEGDIHEAKGWLVEVEDPAEIDHPGARRAAEVIVSLKEAASR